MRSPHIRVSLSETVLPSDILERNRTVAETFYKLMLERVHELVIRPPKWGTEDSPMPELDDVVLFVYSDAPMAEEWKLGRVVDIQGNNVCLSYVKTPVSDGPDTMGRAVRNGRQVSIIVKNNECDLNSYQSFLQFYNKSHE